MDSPATPIKIFRISFPPFVVSNRQLGRNCGVVLRYADHGQDRVEDSFVAHISDGIPKNDEPSRVSPCQARLPSRHDEHLVRQLVACAPHAVTWDKIDDSMNVNDAAVTLGTDAVTRVTDIRINLVAARNFVTLATR